MLKNVLEDRNIEFDVKSVSVLGRNKTREENEDYFHEDKERNIYIVADGLGGHGNGREASRTAGQLVANQLNDLYEELKEIDYPPQEVERKIKVAIEYVNSEMFCPAAKRSKKLQGMGTTLVTLVYHNGWAYVHNVGDSHGFVYGETACGKREAILLTTDDRIIKPEWENYSKDELKIKLLGSKLKQYIGKEDTDVHLGGVCVNGGDTFLLATDGLLEPIHRTEIADMLSEEDFDKIPDMLLERANSPEKMLELYHKYTGKSTVDAYDKLAGADDITFILLRAREVGKSAS